MASLAALSAVVGLASIVHDAAFQSFVPRLVPGRLLTPAHARLDQSDAVARACGPALAGGLVTLVGAPFAVLVDAVSFVVSAVLLLRVRVSEPPSGPGSLRGLPARVLEGLAWVYRHPMLRPMALGDHGWFLCSAAAGAVLTPFALRTLGLRPFVLGLALAAAGVGAVLGSSSAVRLGARFGAGRVIVAGQVSAGVAWLLIALTAAHGPGLALLFVGQLLVGLDIGASSSNEMGYRQVVTPDRLQGRMNAGIRSVNRGALVLGAPLGGLLGDLIGYRPLLLGVAAGYGLVAFSVGRSAFGRARLGDHHCLAAAGGR